MSMKTQIEDEIQIAGARARRRMGKGGRGWFYRTCMLGAQPPCGRRGSVVGVASGGQLAAPRRDS
jgi:hypothetical protein